MSNVVDLSRLPQPTIVHALDWEGEVTGFIAALKADLPEWAGIFESDSFIKAARTWAYRLTLEQQSHNQDARAILLAYADGSDLDHLAESFYSFANIARATGESDASFRDRIQLAPEAFSSAGTLGGYAFHARAVDPIAIPYVDVWFPQPGFAQVAVQTADDIGDDAAAILLDAVREKLNEDEHKNSDILTVSRVERVDVIVRAVIHVARGPDAGLVVAAANAGLGKLEAIISRPRQVLSVSALANALHSDAAIRVLVEMPVDEVATGEGQAIRIATRDIRAEVTNA